MRRLWPDGRLHLHSKQLCLALQIPALAGDLAAYLPTGPDFYSFSLPFLKKLIGDLYS